MRIVNGQIVLDTNSLQVDRALRDAVGDVAVEYVEENPLEKVVNSRSYSKYQLSPRWDARSTAIFYDGLSQWGTDFDMISRMFPERSRKQVKNKYTLEERRHPDLVRQALISKRPVDMEEYSRVSNIEFKSVATLEAELADLRSRFEAEREEAIVEAQQRKVERPEVSEIPPQIEGQRKKSKKRRTDDGLLVLGSIEEVEAQERMEAMVSSEEED